MNKKPSKVRIAFYVEGPIEKQLIKFIRLHYELHKIVDIKDAVVTSDNSDIKIILKEIQRFEKDINFSGDSILILLFDEKLKVNNKPKIIKIIQLSKPSIEYPIAKAMGIKLNRNDKIKKHKNIIKKELNFENKENYLLKRNVEQRIDFDILLDELGDFGNFVKELIKIRDLNLEDYDDIKKKVLNIKVH